MTMTAGLCIAVLVMVTGSLQAEEPEWSYQTYMDSDFTLECNDSNVMVMAGDRVEWYSPTNVPIMYSDDEKYMLSDANGVADMRLKVMKIQNEDKGVYICKIYRNNAFHWHVNRAINLYEPKYRHIIDKYRNDIMIGGIAAAALFIPLVVICFVYKCRFRTDEEKEASRYAHKMRKMHGSHPDLEAGALPVKSHAQNGAGTVNPVFDESTNL